MKHIFSFILLCAASHLAVAQDIHFFLTGGIINYQGDLQPRRFTFSQAKPFVGGGFYIEATERLNFRLGVLTGKISSDDKLGKYNVTRNLNFQSKVTEVHIGAEFDILNSYEHVVVPYAFAGIAGYHFNPFTLDSSGNKVYLQPLGTEGQGFYLGRKKYPLNQMAIPFGGGLKMALSDMVNIRLEAALRKLFTDYLDDVSATYADEDDLRANNGQLAVQYAFRGDELKQPVPYPDATSKRGNPASKDFYYTVSLSISFRLQGNGGSKKTGKGKVGCPVNISGW
jgi:Domain of unknown function (DUF6089)